MLGEMVDRIKRIARLLEDPDKCEWDEHRIRSDLGFWCADPFINSPYICAVESNGYPAGWLIECLWKSGWLVTAGNRHVIVIPSGEVAKVRKVDIFGRDLLSAIVRGAEMALGLASEESRSMEDA